jgi:hypothetical protein
MNLVEPFSIETNRERLALALSMVVDLSTDKKKRAEDPEDSFLTEDRLAELQGLLSGDYKNESMAIYYTLRLQGVEEVDFADKVGSLGVDDIYVTVEQKGDDQVQVWTLPKKQEETAEAAAV